jgi:hypothetical protein
VEPKTARIVVDASGSGGLDEVLAALKDDQVQYAGFRVVRGSARRHQLRVVFIWRDAHIHRGVDICVPTDRDRSPRQPHLEAREARVCGVEGPRGASVGPRARRGV